MPSADGGSPVDPDQEPAVGDELFPSAAVRPRSVRARRRGGRGRLVAVGAGAFVLTLAAGVGLGATVARPEAPAAAPVPGPTVTVTQAPEPPVAAAGPLAEPTRLEVPSLGIDSPLIDLFVAEDGTMGVPDTAQEVGWWEDGPVPGEPGASLIAAHVSYQGDEGAFAELGSLAVGDEVRVERADGTVATYSVASVEQFPKDDFPDERVYSYDGPTRLHLVTCGGAFSRRTGHYLDNVVVFADLVSDTRTPTDA